MPIPVPALKRKNLAHTPTLRPENVSTYPRTSNQNRLQAHLGISALNTKYLENN